MNRAAYILIIGLITVSAILLNYQLSASSTQEKSFAHIIPVDGGQYSIQFFDTKTGKMYTYDRTLQQIIRIVQLEELGKPATIILEPALDSESKFINFKK